MSANAESEAQDVRYLGGFTERYTIQHWNLNRSKWNKKKIRRTSFNLAGIS